MDGDDKVEARVVWRHLQLAPWLLRRPSQPGRSWAERPAAMMLEVLRFYLEGPRERWEEHAPPTGKGFPRRQRPGGTAHPPAQGS